MVTIVYILSTMQYLLLVYRMVTIVCMYILSTMQYLLHRIHTVLQSLCTAVLQYSKYPLCHHSAVEIATDGQSHRKQKEGK